MTDPSKERPADGTPAADGREQVLDPGAGAGGHPSETIRDQQSTHEAGAVPAAYEGDTPDGDRAEDAAREPESWDGSGNRI